MLKLLHMMLHDCNIYYYYPGDERKRMRCTGDVEMHNTAPNEQEVYPPPLFAEQVIEKRNIPLYRKYKSQQKTSNPKDVLKTRKASVDACTSAKRSR